MVDSMLREVRFLRWVAEHRLHEQVVIAASDCWAEFTMAYLLGILERLGISEGSNRMALERIAYHEYNNMSWPYPHGLLIDQECLCKSWNDYNAHKNTMCYNEAVELVECAMDTARERIRADKVIWPIGERIPVDNCYRWRNADRSAD